MLYVTMKIAENGNNDGILLAWSKGHMRIALEDSADAVELREVDGQWTLEDGTPVELDGVFTDGNTDGSLFGELHPRASAAGHLGGSVVVIPWSRFQSLPATSMQ